MELTSDLLLEAKFSQSKRGYDLAEVDDFLERCAEGIDVLLERLKSEYERAERAEARVAQLEAQLAALAEARPETPEPAPAPEPVVEALAPEPETETPPASVEEPMRVLMMAERTAEATVTEARAEADRIRTEAETIARDQRAEAERLLSTARDDAEAEARRAGEAARREVEAEVTDLRRNRDDLNVDIRNLQRWLDEQRGRMRTTARELQRLIDDPTALREFPLPSVASDDDEGAGDGATDESPAPAPAPAPSAAGPAPDTDGEPTQAVPPVDGEGTTDPRW